MRPNLGMITADVSVFEDQGALAQATNRHDCLAQNHPLTIGENE